MHKHLFILFYTIIYIILYYTMLLVSFQVVIKATA